MAEKYFPFLKYWARQAGRALVQKQFFNSKLLICFGAAFFYCFVSLWYGVKT